MRASEIIIAARKLIEDKKNWTQYAFARDASGEMVAHSHPTACMFCAAGAMMHVSYANDFPLTYAKAYYFLNESGIVGVTETNDTLGHHGTLVMFDRAIEKALEWEKTNGESNPNQDHAEANQPA